MKRNDEFPSEEIVKYMKNSKQIQAEKIKSESKEKQPFVEPKLTFVEPKLVKHGDVKDITAGFFGGFYP